MQAAAVGRAVTVRRRQQCCRQRKHVGRGSRAGSAGSGSRQAVEVVLAKALAAVRLLVTTAALARTAAAALPQAAAAGLG